MEFDLGLQQVTSGMGTAREAAELGKAYERALRYLGERSVEYARAYTPVRTGRLRDGWRYEVDLSSRTVRVKNDVPYARAVNDGHWQEEGRYVPQIGADGQGRRLKSRYVAGRHMMERASMTARSYDMAQAAAMVREDIRRMLEGKKL